MYVINVIFRQNCKNLTFGDIEIEKKLLTFLFGGGRGVKGVDVDIEKVLVSNTICFSENP